MNGGDNFIDAEIALKLTRDSFYNLRNSIIASINSAIRTACVQFLSEIHYNDDTLFKSDKNLLDSIVKYFRSRGFGVEVIPGRFFEESLLKIWWRVDYE